MYQQLRRVYRLTGLQHAKPVHKALQNVAAGIGARVVGLRFPEKWHWKFEMVFGLYEPETAAFFRRVLEPGMNVVDVGAHIGYFTRQFSTLVGRAGSVWAFEPHPGNHALLEANTRSRANVRRIKLGLLDRHETLRFHESGDHAGAHSLYDDRGAASTIEIDVVPFDEYWAQHGRPPVHLVKMDIQGAEAGALRGMKEMLASSEGTWVVLEYSPELMALAGCSGDDLWRLLRELGLAPHRITASGDAEPLDGPPVLPGLYPSEGINLACRRQRDVTARRR
jgi:FkbM family methyltransferase